MKRKPKRKIKTRISSSEGIIDPLNHAKRWEKGKDKIKGVSKANFKLIKEYLEDMELGLYSKHKKPLKPSTLNNNKQKIVFLCSELEKRFKTQDAMKLKNKQLALFFKEMSEGKIKTKRDGIYKSLNDYITAWNKFFNWYRRKKTELGLAVIDLSIGHYSQKENEFVYLTFEDIKKVSNRSKFFYKTLILFVLDSGVRPKELFNIKVSDVDFEPNETLLNIRIAKTFGRKIKLMLCSNLLKDYIESENLGKEDYLFSKHPRIINEYLKRTFTKTLCEKDKKGKVIDIKTKGGKYISEINLYDIRHNSVCYWLPRYKNESALKYRFGWKKSNMIFYYSKFLGMKDTIEEKDLILDDEVKTRIESNLDTQKKENNILKEQVEGLIRERELVKEEIRQEIFTQFGILFGEDIIKKGKKKLGTSYYESPEYKRIKESKEYKKWKGTLEA